VIGVAFLIGFDADATPLEWLAATGLIGLFVLALTWVAVAIGVVASGPEAASGFTFAILFLPYVSSAFVPPESMPAVLEAIATYNPITPITDTLRGLLLGTGAGDSALAAVVWCLGIFLVARLGAALLFRRKH
jgi:ABC-2 type transport system permease protein